MPGNEKRTADPARTKSKYPTNRSIDFERLKGYFLQCKIQTKSFF